MPRRVGHGRPAAVARSSGAVTAVVVLVALVTGCTPFGAADLPASTEAPGFDDLVEALSEDGWVPGCEPVGVPHDLKAPIVSVTVTPRDVFLSPRRVEAGNVTFIAANESPTPVAVSIDRLIRPQDVGRSPRPGR